MSFYNSLFMQLIKKNPLNQETFNLICATLISKVSTNPLFEPVIYYFNNNISISPQTQSDVVEFLKIIISRCADIIYTDSKGALDDKDKFSRIGKFPQPECLMALSAIGYEIKLCIDIEKMQRNCYYVPIGVKEPDRLTFHLNNNGVFSYL
jgi:hypothetical protein